MNKLLTDDDFMWGVLDGLVDDEPEFLDAVRALVRKEPGSDRWDLVYAGFAAQIRKLVLDRADKMRGDDLEEDYEQLLMKQSGAKLSGAILDGAILDGAILARILGRKR